MANNRVSPFDIQDSSILDGEFNTFCTNLETIQRKFLEDWIKTWRESREETISNHYEKVMTECEGSCFVILIFYGQRMLSIFHQGDGMKNLYFLQSLKCFKKSKKGSLNSHKLHLNHQQL